MILSHIVAVSENGVIGKDNTLLWHYSEDLAYFKKKTSGKIIILGRKTFDSLKKPLPNRFHIVISKNHTNPATENINYVGSLADAYELAKKMTLHGQWPEEVMIVGGGQIYKASLKDTDFLYITRIPGTYDGDTFYALDLPPQFVLKSSQTSETTPGLRYEIWSKQIQP